MITASKRLLLTARDFFMEVRFYECRLTNVSGEIAKEDAKKRIFDSLKKRGFSFDHNFLDETGVFRGDNYGNYELGKIVLSDFKEIKPNEFIAEIEKYLSSIFLKYFEQIDRQKNDFIKTVTTSCNLFIDFSLKDIEILEFAIENSALESKRHKFYSLWEYFKSYIVFFSHGGNDSFTYIEFGYD